MSWAVAIIIMVVLILIVGTMFVTADKSTTPTKPLPARGDLVEEKYQNLTRSR